MDTPENSQKNSDSLVFPENPSILSEAPLPGSLNSSKNQNSESILIKSSQSSISEGSDLNLISDNKESNKDYQTKDSQSFFKEKEISIKPAKNNEDFTYKKTFFLQEWFHYSNYMDIDLIQERIPSFKYLWNSCQALENFCTEKLFEHTMEKPDLFESQNAKNIVRNGIPPKYMRKFLLKLFKINTPLSNSETKYKQLRNLVLKNYNTENLGNYVPYFTGLKTLDESLSCRYLNERGILALKEILWMVNHLINEIEFCPILINLISMILLFCNKYETLEIIINLINMNLYVKDLYLIRWHVRFDYNENVKMITSIAESLKEISYKSCGELYEHLKKINFRPEVLYEDMCFGFFYKYFNFFGMIRLLPFYLLEGVKSFYRLIYAIEKITKDSLIKVNNPDKIIQEVRELCKSIDDITDLFEIGYAFNLTRYNNKYEYQADINTKQTNKNNIYYLPKINCESLILTEKQIIHLWELIPIDFKLCDISIIYKFNRNNPTCKLEDVINAIQKKYKDNINVLFLIKTVNQEIFGFLINENIKNTGNKFIKPNKSFLVGIEPDFKIYKINDDVNEVLLVNNDKIIFGNNYNETSAIKIEGDLMNGQNCEGDCFNSPKFVKDENGNFQIEFIEIFKLEKSQFK